jgi:AcrR family transcriptional regulator
LADQDQKVNARESSRREARAQRILNAAASLILRWGYQKTTIDDIARQAGVAKGTIYLHWKTREELFEALITREKIEMAQDIRQRITGDREGATLRGILKHSALAMMKRPLLKAILLRDIDILGKLAQSAQSDANHLERLAGFKMYFELLREHGLMRTDLNLRAQLYMFSAIYMGFFLVAPMMPEEYVLADEEIADLMAETVHRSLEPDHSVSSDALQATSRAFIQYMDYAMAKVQEKFQRELLNDSRA